MNDGKKMFSWMNPSLEVRKTEKYGKEILPVFVDGSKEYKKNGAVGEGVFAKNNIAKGEILFVMGGYILDINDENDLVGILADKPIEVSENFSIGPRNLSDIPLMPQHYVNHSCEPNAGFQGQIFMEAMRDISVDEEVVYDYAMVMHSNAKSNSYFKIDCLCGSSLCRKFITEDDWKNKDLQAKYDGYFQYFLQEKINKNKTNDLS